MYKLQADKLLAAGMPPALVDVFTKCTQALEHNGPIYVVEDQPLNSDPNRYATVTLKTNPGKRALNILGGDAFFADDIYVTNNIITNGASGTSMAFRNDSTETVPAGGVMQISGYGKKVDGTRYLKIVKPVSTSGGAGNNTYPRLHAINGNDPVGAGKFGICTTEGFALALCDNATAYDQAWGAKPAQWFLSTGRSGFKTFGAAEADGRTLVYQNQIFDAMGVVITGDIAQGMSGPVTIRDASENDAGYDVTAYDRLLLTSKNSPVGSKVDLYYRNGKWWIGGEDKCPT